MKNKKRTGWILVVALAAIVLAACASQVLVEPTTESEPMAQAQENPAMELAAGTLALEAENAITAEQSAELLPLWKAYASLADADGVADAELNAVLEQIKESMTDAQMTAIEAYEMDPASIQEMIGITSTSSDDASATSSGRGQGMGMGDGSGPGGGDVTQLSEEQIAEMRAEREAAGTSPMVLTLVEQIVAMLETLS